MENDESVYRCVLGKSVHADNRSGVKKKPES